MRHTYVNNSEAGSNENKAKRIIIEAHMKTELH